MATGNLVVAQNAGATLTCVYDTGTLQVSSIVLDTTKASKPINWQVLHNGSPVRSGTVSPGLLDTWNVPAGTLTLQLINGHAALPVGYQLLTWT